MLPALLGLGIGIGFGIGIGKGPLWRVPGGVSPGPVPQMSRP